MYHPNYKYIAAALPRIDSKRKVVPLKQFVQPTGPIECFISWCRYDIEYLNHWESNNLSVKGYQGSCYADYIPVDIDNHDLNRSLNTCQTFIKDIVHNYEVPIESLKIYFSGCKGFHVEILTSLFGNIQPAADLPYRFKKVVLSFGYDDFDLRIYKANSLLRLPNSINSKSGLYKISLTPQEINVLTFEQILDLARRPRHLAKDISHEDWQPRDGLVHLWNNANIQTNEKLIGDFNRFDYPGVEKGHRNETALTISRQLFTKGLIVDQVKDYIVNVWNPTNNPPVRNGQSLLRTVESAHGFNVSDSGLIEITKHLRTDPYYNSLNNDQKSIYIYIITHLNERPKMVWGEYLCRPNQFIYSPRTLAKNTNTTPQIVKTLINKLVDWGRIDVEVLRNNRKAACSRLTFFPFSLNPLANTQTNTSNIVDKQ